MKGNDASLGKAGGSNGRNLATLTTCAPDFSLFAMRTLTAIIYPGETGRWLVACNPETGTTTQGKTVEEATSLYLEEVDLPERRGALLTTFEVDNA